MLAAIVIGIALLLLVNAPRVGQAQHEKKILNVVLPPPPPATAAAAAQGEAARAREGHSR